MPLPVLKTTLAGVSADLSEADCDIICNNERELSNEIVEDGGPSLYGSFLIN